MDEKQASKLQSRHEELLKQEANLKKEYTTLLRKFSSVNTALNNQQLFTTTSATLCQGNLLIQKDSLDRIPDLQWYNDQIHSIVQKLDSPEEFIIPDEIKESYDLYKDTPLLYNDIK